MSIKIELKKNISESKIKNYVLFSDENLRIAGFNKISLSEYSNLITNIVKNDSVKDKNFLSFNINANQKIILIN